MPKLSRFLIAANLIWCTFSSATSAQELPATTNQGLEALASGNRAMACGKISEARDFYLQADELSGDAKAIAVFARLNAARVEFPKTRKSTLIDIYPLIDELQDADVKAAVLLNVAHQARQVGMTKMAYTSLQRLEEMPEALTNRRLAGDKFNIQAQLYEDANRLQEALTLNSRGLEAIDSLSLSQVAELQFKLNWREARLLKGLSQPEGSLAAFLRAAEFLESFRQSLPIEDAERQSTYRNLIEPFNNGLVEMLFAQSRVIDDANRTTYLAKARKVLELTRQSEMQDFLGDRCTVETVQGDPSAALPQGTAILYVSPFAGHTELLLQIGDHLSLHQSDVELGTLIDTAVIFAGQMRYGLENYQDSAELLYDWIISPVRETLNNQNIDTLVVVPSSDLRMVPMGALFDGKKYLIEAFAVSSVAGMSMTFRGDNQTRNIEALVAGMSEAGPVAEKVFDSIDSSLITGNTRALPPNAIVAQVRSLRSVKPVPQFAALEQGTGGKTRTATRQAVEEMKDSLALPGVAQEIEAIGQTLKATTLLNENFTLDSFAENAAVGKYRIVHIASHGVFGGNAESSFVMTYDDLLTLNHLQNLLKSEENRKNPIELLSLSACQTAEGSDRAPLGIAGAAIKARARSVLGTLWPVEDNAAKQFMKDFYSGLADPGITKARAQQKAQVSLLNQPETAHPFFWAPFTLIGNWQ